MIDDSDEPDILIWKAHMYASLGGFFQQDGNYREAEREYAKAITIYQDLGHVEGIGPTLHSMGCIAMAQNDLERAEKLLSQSREALEQHGNVAQRAQNNFTMSLLAERRGELVKALRLVTQSHLKFEELHAGPQTVGTSAAMRRIVMELESQRRAQITNPA